MTLERDKLQVSFAITDALFAESYPPMWLSWAIVLLGGLLSSPILAQTTPHASRNQHVIVVSFDGLAAFLVDDPKASLPTLRRMAREDTIADGGMKGSNPSVTWPNHTTMITGVRPERHSVLANGVLVRGGLGVPVHVDSKRDRNDLVRGNTIVDSAHAVGLKTGEINWPCTRGSSAYDDSFPDVADTLLHTTPHLDSDLLRLGILEDTTDKSFQQKSGPGRDWVWMEAACHLIRERAPNLLIVHLLNVDSTHPGVKVKKSSRTSTLLRRLPNC